MGKTININLGGTLFQIEEEAYQILKNYLQSIDRKFANQPGGNETIEDIEFRIAEIFRSGNATAGIITLDNVNEMIGIIGKPEEIDQESGNEGESGASDKVVVTSKKLFRNPENRIIGGVCGGLGAYLFTDPVWIRILFILGTFAFGIGFYVYLALWIALPSAKTDQQKKEMYGSGKNPAQPALSGMEGVNRIGRAFDAVFQAIGKVLFIIVRVILIAFGICFVLGGFLALVAFVMFTFFHYPGAFSTDVAGFTAGYIPDFLDYVISPNLLPWVKAMIVIVFIVPFLALIYGGIRLIFWFRARDGFIWLGAFILWIVSLTALSMMLFNEGIGFSEKGRTSYHEYFNEPPDTLYVKDGLKISSLGIDKEIAFADDPDARAYFDDDKKEIYFRPDLDIEFAEDNKVSVEVIKRSAGRSRLDARIKSESLLYGYSLSGDTLTLDEYFTIPSSAKWSFDYVFVKLYVPAGQIFRMDRKAETLYSDQDEDESASFYSGRLWKMTEDGPEVVETSSQTK
jgi:phage shock protein PspC (stress-responsive transcriptional regulator)